MKRIGCFSFLQMTRINEIVEQLEILPDLVRVCDIPFFSEPERYYRKRVEKGINIARLRKMASVILRKQADDIAADDLRVVEVILFGLEVKGDSENTYHIAYIEDRESGFFQLSCTCKGWCFRQKCKHIKRVKEEMELPEYKYMGLAELPV